MAEHAISPRAARRLEQVQRLLIDGQWRPALSGVRMTRHSPAHDVAVSEYALGGPADAVAAAAELFLLPLIHSVVLSAI